MEKEEVNMRRNAVIVLLTVVYCALASLMLAALTSQESHSCSPESATIIAVLDKLVICEYHIDGGHAYAITTGACSNNTRCYEEGNVTLVIPGSELAQPALAVAFFALIMSLAGHVAVAYTVTEWRCSMYREL